MRYLFIAIGLIILFVILVKLLVFTIKWAVIFGVIALGIVLLLKLIGGRKRSGE